MNMPMLDVAKLKEVLTPGELKLTMGILVSKGKNAGRLLTAKPKVSFDILNVPFTSSTNGKTYIRQEYHAKARQGATAYIWRMTCFQLCSWAPHVCMPMTASFNLRCKVCSPQERKLIKRLDAIVDKIVDTVHPAQRGGLLRWKQALYG